MRKMNDRQYCVLGLGIFGSTVAKTLSSYDCEVLAIDKDMTCVERLADDVTQAVQCDITNKEQLRAVGVADCDVAIVGTGSHLEDSVMAIINLKELGVPYVVAKAKNKRYMQIFQKVGADRVVRPEKEYGKQLGKSLLSRNIFDMIDIDANYSIVELKVPKEWVGKSLKEIDARSRFGINVIGLRNQSSDDLKMNIDVDYHFQEGDHIVLVTDMETIADSRNHLLDE